MLPGALRHPYKQLMDGTLFLRKLLNTIYWNRAMCFATCSCSHTALRRSRLHIRNRVDVESFTTVLLFLAGLHRNSNFCIDHDKQLFNLIWLNQNLEYHAIDYCFTSLGKIIGILNPYRNFTMNKFGWCWTVGMCITKKAEHDDYERTYQQLTRSSVTLFSWKGHPLPIARLISPVWRVIGWAWRSRRLLRAGMWHCLIIIIKVKAHFRRVAF